jgi:3'(2'), 5'-bisphosphate nucleotidase
MKDETDLELATRLAVSAGELLAKFRKENKVPEDLSQRKAYGQAADVLANNFLMNEFQIARPNDLVLSEEGEDPTQRLSAARCWIVDPLDGTFYFANDRNDFAVQIALWEKESNLESNISAAAVSLPAFGTIYTSGDAKQIAKSKSIPRLLVSGSRPPKELPRITELFDESFGGVEIKSAGSVGAKVVQILEGQADCYVHTTGFYEWDIAAPLGIAVNAGLVVCDINGNPLQLNKKNVRVENVIITKKELLEVVLRAVL